MIARFNSLSVEATERRVGGKKAWKGGVRWLRLKIWQSPWKRWQRSGQRPYIKVVENGKGFWALDGQAIRNANRGDSRESIRRKTPIFIHLRAIRANCLKPAIRNFGPRIAIRREGVQSGNPETIRESGDSRESIFRFAWIGPSKFWATNALCNQVDLIGAPVPASSPSASHSSALSKLEARSLEQRYQDKRRAPARMLEWKVHVCLGHTPSTAGTFRKKFRKDPKNALREFPGIPLESTAGIPQALYFKAFEASRAFPGFSPPQHGWGHLFFKKWFRRGPLRAVVMEFPAVLRAFLIVPSWTKWRAWTTRIAGTNITLGPCKLARVSDLDTCLCCPLLLVQRGHLLVRCVLQAPSQLDNVWVSAGLLKTPKLRIIIRGVPWQGGTGLDTYRICIQARFDTYQIPFWYRKYRERP